LPDGCPGCRVPHASDTLDTDDKRHSREACHYQIEQSEVASAAFDLELRPDQTSGV
jgi:hypothetical protein